MAYIYLLRAQDCRKPPCVPERLCADSSYTRTQQLCCLVAPSANVFPQHTAPGFWPPAWNLGKETFAWNCQMLPGKEGPSISRPSSLLRELPLITLPLITPVPTTFFLQGTPLERPGFAFLPGLRIVCDLSSFTCHLCLGTKKRRYSAWSQGFVFQSERKENSQEPSTW